MHRHQCFWRLRTAALLLSLLSACGRTAADPVASTRHGALTGKWLLVSYGPEGHPVVVPLSRHETVWFSRGRLHASGGCSFFDGEYTVRGNTLALGPIATAAMICEPASPLQYALETHTSFAVVGDTLTINYPEGVLRLTRLSALEMPTERPRPTDGPPLPEPSRTPAPTPTTPPRGPPTATPTASGLPPTPTDPPTEQPRSPELDAWLQRYASDAWTRFGCCLEEIQRLDSATFQVMVVVEADLAQGDDTARKRLASDLATSLHVKQHQCLRDVSFQSRDGQKIGEDVAMPLCERGASTPSAPLDQQGNV